MRGKYVNLKKKKTGKKTKKKKRNVSKRTISNVRPAKIQISLRIRAVWSESSLCAFWIAKEEKLFYADNGDSDQTVRLCRLIWVFVGRTWQKGRFHKLLLK